MPAKKKTSLRLKTRIVITLSLFSLLLSVIFGVFVILSSMFSQDYVFYKVVGKITAGILEHFRQNHALPHDLPHDVQVYLSLQGSVPDQLRRFHLETRPDGLYESHDPHDSTPIDTHYSITTLPEIGERLYVFLDVRDYKLKHAQGYNLAAQIGIPALLTSLIGTIIGLLLAKRVISPVGKLAELVRQARPDKPPDGLSESFAADEVGELAGTIESTMRRLGEFILREREFTRNVSHELRTPLAVIKNGAELLSSNPHLQQLGDLRPLERIERAVADMEKLVETFMFLARETDISSRLVDCELSERIAHQLDKYRYMLAGKRNPLVFSETMVSVRVVPELFDIIFGNLIRNAFQYAGDGEIAIELQADRLSIVNNLPTESSAGHMLQGIGHTITARLCEGLGWRFTFELSSDKAIATVIFLVP